MDASLSSFVMLVTLVLLGSAGACSVTKGLVGEPNTRDQSPDEQPPPLGQTGRVVVGPVGFGQCQNPGLLDNQRAGLPTQPADPWAAVDAQHVPAALPLDAWQQRSASVIVRPEITGCTAAHDHCLRECTWLVRDVSDDAAVVFAGIPVHRRSDGIFTTASGMLTASNRVAGEIKDGYTAYRTVPATARLLAPGRLVAAMSNLPESEQESLSAWTMGPIDTVDLDTGLVKLVGEPEYYPVFAVRVVVLTSKDGGPVQLTPGLAAADIVVRADEVFVP